MDWMIRKMKRWIKQRKRLYYFLFSVYHFVGFDQRSYGYLNTEKKIERLLSKLEEQHPEKIRKCYDPKKNNQFIFIGTPSVKNIIEEGVFGEVVLGNTGKYDCSFYNTHVCKHNSFKLFHKLYFSINKHISLPGKGLWERAYQTEAMKIKEDKNVFVIFCPGLGMSDCFSQPRLWERIFAASEKTCCRRILYLVDPMDKIIRYGSEAKSWFPFFDWIAGCAYEDQKRHGIKFIDTPCIQYPIKPKPCSYDIYMRGADAGRLAFWRACYEFLKQNGVKCCFYVYTEKFDVISEEGFCYTNQYLPYQDTIKEELQANVLLEIVVPGVNSGATLRYHEAVMYGKKLLTNNPTVKELDFYDERFIRYFEKPEEIDIEWVKASEKVDYPYQDEFSIVSFCRKLEQLEETQGSKAER